MGIGFVTHMVVGAPRVDVEVDLDDPLRPDLFPDISEHGEIFTKHVRDEDNGYLARYGFQPDLISIAGFRKGVDVQGATSWLSAVIPYWLDGGCKIIRCMNLSGEVLFHFDGEKCYFVSDEEVLKIKLLPEYLNERNYRVYEIDAASLAKRKVEHSVGV